MNIFRFFTLFTALGALVFFSGCVSTPDSRIASNPQMFQPQPPEFKEKIARGMISEGMNRDAVYLAWGRPAQIRVGQRDGTETEFWQYTQIETHVIDTPYYYYPYPHRYARNYYAMGPTFVHTEVPGRWALFQNNRVTQWSLPIR